MAHWACRAAEKGSKRGKVRKEDVQRRRKKNKKKLKKYQKRMHVMLWFPGGLWRVCVCMCLLERMRCQSSHFVGNSKTWYINAFLDFMGWAEQTVGCSKANVTGFANEGG